MLDLLLGIICSPLIEEYFSLVWNLETTWKSLARNLGNSMWVVGLINRDGSAPCQISQCITRSVMS